MFGYNNGPMDMVGDIRRHCGVLARVNLALFALAWVSLVAAPCLMAMQVGAPEPTAHDCPHCPPKPCHEVQADQCDGLDGLSALRLADQVQAFVALPSSVAVWAHTVEHGDRHVPAFRLPPTRAGPRQHLLHLQFNE